MEGDSLLTSLWTFLYSLWCSSLSLKDAEQLLFRNKMTKRIAVSPLTGRIHQGRVNKTGNAFVGNKEDVTSDVLLAIIEKAEYHGGSFDIEGGNRKWIVTVKEEALDSP